jgi:hypothetical protein
VLVVERSDDELRRSACAGRKLERGGEAFGRRGFEIVEHDERGTPVPFHAYRAVGYLGKARVAHSRAALRRSGRTFRREPRLADP